jgi:hypothetical protein
VAIIAATAHTIHEATQFSHRALVHQSAGSMIPLFGGMDAAALRDAKILPFVEQDAFWKEVSTAVASCAGRRVEPVQPTPFEIYMHCQATTEAVQEGVGLKQDTGISAQGFILNDNELGDFERRLW